MVFAIIVNWIYQKLLKEKEGINMKRPTVLLVDDEAIVRDSVSEWLKNDEYDVECTSNARSI